MIKLALTDLDDTLIPFGQGRASDRALAAIHSVLDAGVRFGPVSGRIPASMSWMFGDDDRCCATGAFSNGQIVRIDGEVVREVTIGAKLLQRVADFLDQHDLPAWLSVQDPANGNKIAFVTRRKERLEQQSFYSEDGRQARIVPRCSQQSYIKCNVPCACDWDEMARIQDALRREVPELSFVFPSQTVSLIDVGPANWNKGAAVRFMAERLGIGIDEVVVFGDSENDLSMIETVPNSVAVANASPEIADAARWHIGASAEDGVAQALEDIAQATSQGKMPAFMDA